ncbi:MAG: BTAD domain-containing putative transcriptional regulator [Bacillota bacterium]|nr:BTAD domain-containing putative transcriptional regulator [Bacillota bacterium]
MDRPSFRSQVQLPSIPAKSLFCERLRQLDIASNRLSILLAPAGFGKTTAALLSLGEHRERTWWFRVEEEDAFLHIFFQHLITCLFRDEPQLAAETLRTLRSLQNLEEEHAILAALICQELSHLYERETQPRFLVFDDYQWLAGRPVFQKILTYFIRNLPPLVRIVITTRRDPELLVGRLSFADSCRQYQVRDLLFTPQETRELVDEVYRLPLTEEQFTLVLERCQGWAAGIYVLCHALANAQLTRNDQRPPAEVESQFSLFFQEYLLGVDTEQKEQLMELSLLDDFTVDELGEIYLQPDPPGFLQLLSANQLCYRTTGEEPTRYYLHTLLRDELRRLYRSSHSREEQSRLYARIAAYYRTQDPPKAIGFCLRGRDLAGAIALGEELARQAFNDGVPESFFPVLALFDEQTVADSPYLLLMSGMRALNLDRIQAQSAFSRALEGFRLRRDDLFLMNSFGMLLVVSYQHNDFVALHSAARRLPVLRILLGGGQARTHLVISFFIALVGRDQLRPAGLLAAYLDRHTIRSDLWQFSYLMIRGIYHYRRGDLTASRANLEHILSHPVMKADDQWRTIGLVSCCNVAFLQSDLELIEYFINEFSLVAERLQSDFALGYAHYLRGFYHHLQGDSAAAQAALEKAREAYSVYGSHVLQMEAECLALSMSEESGPELVERARSIAIRLRKEDPGHGLAEFARATLGILLMNAGEMAAAGRELLASLGSSRRKGARQAVYALYLLLADYFQRSGKPDKARRYARKWLGLGENFAYRYALPFSQSALERVLAASASDISAAPYSQSLRDFYEKIRKRREPEPDLDVRFFGPFVLQVGEQTVTESDFKTRKVSGLLKYILLRGEPLSRERLAGIFWPESDRKSAGTSLRVALYELRKLLAELGIGFDGKTPLLQEDKEGFSVCPGQTLRFDVRQMDQLYERWRSCDKSEERDLLLEICALYRGPLLEDGDYDDWATILREYYSGIYCEALHALGERAVADGDLEAVEQLLRGLAVDPLDETCCRHLLALYEQSGQKERAAVVRRQFRRRFRREMGFDASI